MSISLSVSSINTRSPYPVRTDFGDGVCDRSSEIVLAAKEKSVYLQQVYLRPSGFYYALKSKPPSGGMLFSHLEYQRGG